jgi:hypothetical protein
MVKFNGQIKRPFRQVLNHGRYTVGAIE